MKSFEWTRRARLVPIAILTAFLVTSAAGAETIWFMGDETDADWDNGDNWKTDFGNGSHTTGFVPEAYIGTYVTSSDMLDPAPALIDTGMAAVTGALYVGGWDASFDGDHGSPLNRAGTLDILGGALEISEKEFGGSPPCHYLRLGYRGADGTVNQSGGAVYGCTSFSFGYRSPDSTGTWNLDGGSIEAPALDVGIQGTGLLLMDDGSITVPEGHTGRISVGHGYSSDEEGYEPGLGFVNQRGGSIDDHKIEIGRNVGAVGTYAVRDGATLEGSSIGIGVDDAFGALTQTGGTVRAPMITIGGSKGAIGALTISGGTLEQTSTSIGSHWLFNGVSGDNGIGRFMVIGPNPVVTAKRYYQNFHSRLVFMLEEESPHISPIVVENTALFETGGTLTIELEPDPIAGGNRFTPSDGQSFVLMTADDLKATGRVSLDSRSTDDWKMVIDEVADPETLSVIYCPGSYSTPPCD